MKIQFLKDNFYLLLGNLLVIAKNIILLPILIKYFGVNIYSIYSLVVISISLFLSISSIGADYFYKRYIPSTRNKKECKKLFLLQAYFQLSVILIFSCVYIVFSLFIHRASSNGLSSYSPIIVVYFLVSYYFWSQTIDYFRYTNRIKYFTIATTITPYLTISFILFSIFILKEIKLNAIFISEILSMVIVSFPLIIKISVEIGLILKSINFKELLPSIKLGLPLSLSSIVDFILSTSDRYLIAIFISTSAVGFYNPAYTLGSLIIILPKVLGTILPPYISRLLDSKETDSAENIVKQSINIFLLVSIPFIFGSFIFSYPLLKILANSDIAQSSKLIVPIIAIASLFFGLNIILNNVLYVLLKSRIILYINLLSAIVNLSLNILLFNIFQSIFVAALTTLFSYLISNILIIILTKKYFTLDFNLKMISKFIFSSSIMALIANYIYNYFPQNKFNLSIEIVLCIIIYLITLSIFSLNKLNSYFYRIRYLVK